MYTRFVRVADGPDAAHRHLVGQDQLKTAGVFRERHQGYKRRYEELARVWDVDVKERWEYVGGEGKAKL
jgi:acyl-CoA dehydrogenase